MADNRQQPYKNLGEHLRGIRQGLRKTLREVSSAIEVEENELRRIEQGADRPSEDILMMLINHFEMPEDDAVSLWRMAGYEPSSDNGGDHQDATVPGGKGTMLVLAFDPRAIYSDGIIINGNRAGIMMNFLQASGTPQQMTTTRVGMSLEQAKNVHRVLGEILSSAEPKHLPPPRRQSNDWPDDEQVS